MRKGNKADLLKTIRLNIKKSYKSYMNTVIKVKPSELFIVLKKEIKILQEIGFSIKSIQEIIKEITTYKFTYITLYRLVKDHIIDKDEEISLVQAEQPIINETIGTKLKCLIN